MANEFKIRKGLIVEGASGGTVVDVQGSQGQLFSVTDDLSGSIFAVSDISGVPILDVNSSGTVNVDGTLNIKNKVVIQTGTTQAQATDYLYIGGNDLSSGDAAIYLGNRGDGTGYGWRFYYAGIGSGNNNNLVIRSENLGSPVDAVTFNQDGFATFAGDVLAPRFDIGTDSTSIIQETNRMKLTNSIANDAGGFDFYTRKTDSSYVNALQILGTGDSTFAAQAFSAATSSGDGSSTLTTKGYVDGLITGATIYRGAWDPSGGGYGSPDLSGVTQTSGYYYICSAAGTAEPNGTGTEPDTWETGDWVIYNDVSGTGQWQKIDNSSVLSGVGTGQTVALWEGAGSVTDSETLGNAPITVSGNNATFAGNVTLSGQAAPQLFLTSNTTGTPNYTLIANASSQFIIGRAGVSNDFTLNSGNATFAGNVDVNGTEITVGTNGSIFAENNLRFKSSGAAYIDHNTVGQSINFRTSVSSSLDTTPLSLTGANATFAGNVDAAGNVEARGYLQAFSTLYMRGTTQIMNKNADGFLNFFERDTSGSETKMNISNVGTLSTSGGATFAGSGNFGGSVNIASGGDLILTASSGSTDTGDIVFYHTGAEAHRLWSGTNTLNYRTDGGTTYYMLHSGNYTDYNTYTTLTATTQSAGDNSTNVATTAYADAAAAAVPIGNYLPLAGGTLTGDLTLTGSHPKVVLNSSGHANLELDRGSTSYDANLLFKTGGAIKWRIWNDGSDDTLGIRDEVNASEMVTFQTGGNVGIGTTDPGYKLDVNGNTRISSTLDVTGDISTSSNIIANTGYIGSNTTQSRDKLRVWNGGLYTIGMISGFTFGPIQNNYAMTFQMNNDNSRGFWWGDDNHSGAQGAMALSTRGFLTVAERFRVGYGQSDTADTPAQALDVSGNAYISGNVGIGTTSFSNPLTVSKDAGGNAIAYFNSLNTNGYGVAIRTADTGNDKYILRLDSNSGNTPVIYATNSGNVGIGTTSPDYKLDVEGDISLVSEGENYAIMSPISQGMQIAVGDPADTATPLVTFDGDQKVGIGTTTPNAKLDIQGTQGQLFSVTDDLSGDIFSVADISGVPILNVNSSGLSTFDGTVEIGTSTVATANAAADDLWLRSTGSNGITISSGNAQTGTIFFGDVANAAAAGFRYNHNTGDMAISAEDNITFACDNVGIGTTSPVAKLHVLGTSSDNATTKAEMLSNSVFSVKPHSTNSGTLAIAQVDNGNSVGMQFTNGSGTSNWDISMQPFGGNVGIGATSPSKKLHLSSTSNNGSDILQQTDGSRVILLEQKNGSIHWQLGTFGSTGGGANNRYSIKNATTGVEALVVHPTNNNVGIGTTNPGTRLHVESPVSGNGLNADFSINGGSGFGMNNLRVEIPQYGSGIRVYSPTSSSTDNSAMSFYQQTSSVGNITINTSSTSFNTTSDYRLKENEEDISDAIERVKELKPLRFNWIKEPGKPKVDGFYAHELAEVVPEAVTGEKDALDWEGNPKYQAIDQAKIVPLLTAALQQAIDKIEELELRIQTIENK